jgi:hypothetical protein
MRDYCANNFGVNHMYIYRPYVGQNWKQTGTRQFFPYSSTANLHEIKIRNNSRTNTKYSQTTQKQEYTLLSTMSHLKPQMTWSRTRMQPPSGINTIKTTSSKMPPAPVVESVTSSSSLSQASSIGIGEFGLNLAWRGTAAAFSMAIKDDLFPKVNFLQGTNTSLDFSKDKTSICGFLQSCCGVSDDEAYHWWEDHRTLVKSIHTDCRNNKIKMTKQQFNGKLI